MQKTVQPWIYKYMPSSLEEFEAQKESLRTLKNFITNFKTQRKKAALIHGPSGCGKTVSVHTIAKNLNLEIVEINASDVRNKAALGTIINQVGKQMSLFAKGKIILVDEIDAVSGTKDRGGIQQLISLIPQTAFPIIMTAQNAYDKKLNKIRSKSEIIQYEPLDYMSIYNILKRICRSENIEHNDMDLKILSRTSGGDARAAINDLQTISSAKNSIKREDIDSLPQRNQTESILKALVKIFKVKEPMIALKALDNVNENFDQTMLWIDENLPYEYTDPKDLAEAYQWLSKADVYKGRIRRWQHWRFIVYIKNHITAGIALSKKKKYSGFTSYKPTNRILKLWKAKMKYMKRNAIAEKIALKTHSSKKEVIKNTLPFIQPIFQKNKEMGNELAEYFELDNEEVSWLRR